MGWRAAGSECFVEVFLVHSKEQENHKGDDKANVGHNHYPKTHPALLLGVKELWKLYKGGGGGGREERGKRGECSGVDTFGPPRAWPG